VILFFSSLLRPFTIPSHHLNKHTKPCTHKDTEELIDAGLFFNQVHNAIFRGLCLREQVKGHCRRPANRQVSISEQDLRKRSSDPSWMKASTRSPTSQTWDPTATWWHFRDPLALLKQKGCIGLNFCCSTGCQSLVSASSPRDQHRGNHSSS
jgi:hypothetical protein